MYNDSRRAFIKSGALYMLAGTFGSISAAAEAVESAPALKIGLVTDIHYADTDDRGARNYRASLPKLQTAVAELNGMKVDFAVHGGDLIDARPEPTPESELRFLAQINAVYAGLRASRHYVLGNHCVYSLTKPEFLRTVHRPRSFYSFDRNGYHVLVLDACYRVDGVDYGRRNFDYRDTEIPAPERNWLQDDLAKAEHKTIVFVHQRLDLPVGSEDAIHSSPEVRSILEASGKVLAVFMGHSHVNDYRRINGIHYCTLDAVVGGFGSASNAYSLVEADHAGNIRLHGFGKDASNPWSVQSASSAPAAIRRAAI